MLITLQKSCLLVIDIQEKLTPHVLNPASLVDNTRWLIRLAKELNVPIHVSEQYPKGLDKTVAALREHTKDAHYSEKVHFSCASDEKCLKKIEDTDCDDIIIAGIETHVCVLQTAMELKALGYNVFVVVDAVSSRAKIDHRYGLKRMKASGISLVTKEMVFFEWLRQAGTPRFKELSKAFLQNQ